MDFPIVTVQARDEVEKHAAALEVFRVSRLLAEMAARERGVKPETAKPPVPNLAARLHGRRVQKLGEWRGADYHYAAIRELNSAQMNYELIHPRYLNGA